MLQIAGCQSFPEGSKTCLDAAAGRAVEFNYSITGASPIAEHGKAKESHVPKAVFSYWAIRDLRLPVPAGRSPDTPQHQHELSPAANSSIHPHTKLAFFVRWKSTLFPTLLNPLTTRLPLLNPPRKMIEFRIHDFASSPLAT